MGHKRADGKKMLGKGPGKGKNKDKGKKGDKTKGTVYTLEGDAREGNVDALEGHDVTDHEESYDQYDDQGCGDRAWDNEADGGDAWVFALGGVTEEEYDAFEPEENIFGDETPLPPWPGPAPIARARTVGTAFSSNS